MGPRLRRAGLGLCVAVGMLVVLELGLRLCVGAPDVPSPFVRARWNMDGPAFQERDGMVIPGYQQNDMVGPFPRGPEPGVPRIFVLGGSSIRAGSRLPPKHEAPARLQEALRASGFPAEVINLGRPGIDSHSHREILSQAIRYEPDLVVLYMGHNDLGNAVLEDRYGTVGASLGLRLRLLLGRLATYTLLRDLLWGDAPQGADPSIVDPVVRKLSEGIQQGTKRDCPPDDPRRALAARDLEDNLVAMATMAQDAGVAVVMVTPVSDWVSAGPLGKGCPELVDNPGLGRSGRHGAPVRGSLVLGPEALEAALAQRPDCSELLFERGLSRLKLGDRGAYEDLRAALEADVLPLRATRSMTDAVRAAAEQSGARLLDLEAVAEDELGAPPPIWFVDVVHLSVRGHLALAAALQPVVVEELDPGP